MSKLDDLIEKIEELDDDRKFTDLPPYEIERVDVAAALLKINGAKHWLPFSQLRHLDGDIYASEWILEKKNLA